MQYAGGEGGGFLSKKKETKKVFLVAVVRNLCETGKKIVKKVVANRHFSNLRA